LCDRNFRNENNGKGYFVYVRNQVTELLTRYGKIVEIRFIGGCNKDCSRQDQDDAINRPDTHKLTGDLKIYKWQKLYSLVHLLQPDCLVIHDVNHENTDAIDFPVDVRAFDYKQFLLEGDIIRPEVNLIVRKQTGEKVYVPIEYCTSLTPNIFWASQEKIIHPSAETISQWYRGAIRARSNLLLNIGPNSYGLIPEYHQTYLRKTAKLVGIS
jgi:alpha-L-fucosidase